MKVDVMIIGAGRSGTTSLYAWMEQHPDIEFSITKEVHYFSVDDLYKRGEKYYHSLFPSTGRKITAAADTYLLIDQVAPERIRQYNPAMKMIILMREPVARAYSNYNYSVNYGHEKSGLGFLETITLEEERLKNKNIADKNNLCHFYGSLYHQHLSYWMHYFPPTQFLLLTSNEMQQNPEAMMKRVFTFLDLSDFPIDTSRKLNQASGAKSKFVQQVLLNRDHWFRRSTRFVVKPFRNILIRSGLIDRIANLNKKKTASKPMSAEEWINASMYFLEDVKLLKSDFNIEFKEFGTYY